MADPRRVLATLARLKRAGVAIALDDFGTGYSSMLHLRRLPLAEVKIDRSFVLGVATDPDDAAIVRSCIDLARALGLRVVAEGVEDERDLADARRGRLRRRPGLVLRPADARRGTGRLAEPAPAPSRSQPGRSHSLDFPRMATISRDEVAHLAKLARLAVTDEELDTFAGQLDVILQAVAQVGEVAAADMPPTSHSVPLTNVLRDDVVAPCLPREEALAGAPDVEDDRFRVPRILDEE